MKEIVKEIRKIAYNQTKSAHYALGSDPVETLQNITFNVQVGQTIDQRRFAKLNLELNSESCLGRVALSAAIIEKHFPNANLQLAEVWKDWLANLMLKLLQEDWSRRFDASFMQELLMYEEPHLILTVDNIQFEPLSIALGQDIKHPQIKTFPLWEGITASVLVSKAWLETDPSKKLKILNQAEKICPGLTLVQENMCTPLELLGQTDKVIEKAK